MSFQRPFLISLKRDSEQPWGFRLVGGKDKEEPHIVQKVAPNSIAERCGLREGDELIQIGRINVQDLSHGQVEDVVLKSHNRLEMFVIREDIFQPRKGQPETQSVKAVVHAQYNSPMGLYSSQNIADTMAQTAEYALTDVDQKKFTSYDDYQKHVSFAHTHPNQPRSFTPPQRAPTPIQPTAHPSFQTHQQHQSNFIMNNTQQYRPSDQMQSTYENRAVSYYQQQQPAGYTQQQFQNKSSVQRVEQHTQQQQRFEQEYPQIAQTPKRVEFVHQPTITEEKRYANQSQTVRTEKQVHHHTMQQQREYTQRPQSPKPMLQNEHHRTIQNEYTQRPQSPRSTMHRQVVQHEQEHTRRPQSPKSILRSEQHRVTHQEREQPQRPQSPMPMMRTEEETYQRKPVQERAAAYREMIHGYDEANTTEQRTQHRGTPYERQVSTSTVQLKNASSPSEEEVYQRKPVQERAAAYQGLVQTGQGSEQRVQQKGAAYDRQVSATTVQLKQVSTPTEDMYQRKQVQERGAARQTQAQVSEQQRGTPYERQVSTSTVQLKQVSSPTPDKRSDQQVYQQRPQHPPSPKVSTRPVMRTSPSPTVSPSTTPNTTRKRMEGIWPPKSNVKHNPKTGFSTTSTGKQLIWPPSPKSGWESDGSWPPSGRQTPQSPTFGRKMANSWNPSPSPPTVRRTPVASPVAPRKAIWPPPSRTNERATHFQPINKPQRKCGKFDDYIQHHASCGVPVTYRPPPSFQNIEVNY